MKLLQVLTCAVIMYSGVTLAADPQPPSSIPLPAGKNSWKLIFQDEFAGSTYDTSKWSPRADWGGNGSFNGGREYYYESQIQVHDGVCHLVAQPNPGVTTFEGSYRSGELLSCRASPSGGEPYKFTFQYGYIEARIKNVRTNGFFGAFWLLPAKPNYVYEWEVDILEMLSNDPRTMYQTYHYREGLPYDQNRNTSWSTVWNPGRNGTAPDIDYSTDYHTYGFDWQSDHVTFYIDGIASGTFNNPGVNNRNIPNSPGYIIIQNMVENSWCIAAGNTLANTNMSDTLYIDYVRVWQGTNAALTTVSIISPTNHATFTAGANISINATASTSSGTIARVEFYQGAVKLGEDTSSPYSYTWNSVAAGSYSLTAKVVDGSSATTTSAAVSITVASTNGVTLNLPHAAWWGGPAYYERFSVAARTEWVSPNFFPICVFYGKPEHAAILKSRGINTYMRAENPAEWGSVDIMTDEGMYLMLQEGWGPSQLGSNPDYVVGWMISEELDMAWDAGLTTAEQEALNVQRQRNSAAGRRAYNDGRFLQSNFGNGVLGTFWAPNTMDDLIAETDMTSVDKYAYTSPNVRFEYGRTPSWTQGDAKRSIAYGWQQDRMVLLGSQLNGTPIGYQKPNFVFIETAMPYLTEAGRETIGLEEMEGATWNALIHGAAGLAWFQHNNDAINGNYSIVTGTPERVAKITAINAQVTRMAPVLNSQPYVWYFGAQLQTRLHVYNGNAYIIAMTDGGSGARTFSLPPGVSGTSVEVVDEGRTLTVTGGTFTDSFAAEHEHHIYRVAVSSSVNQSPVVNAQSVTTTAGTAKAITLTGSDPEGSALTYAIVANPAHGTLTGTGASRTYTPAVNYSGSDSFTFKVNDGTLDSTPATVSITVTAAGNLLPSPWVTSDIGSVGIAGSATQSGGVYTVKGSGTDIWDMSDAFRFVYQTVSGDCEIKARVTAVGNTDPWAKAGVMVRETLSANSTYGMMVITPGNGASSHYRTSTGGSCVADQSAGKTAPYWVRMVRSGNNFTGYMSPDGQTWTQLGAPRTIPMGTTVYIGLAVTAHNNGLLNTSTLDNVVVGGGGANQPPTANVQSVSTAEDTAKAITLTGSDPEGSALTYAIVANPAHGTLSGSGASRTYTPAANYNGADSFTFRVSDGALTSTPATVAITVTAVNDAPTCALTAPTNGATFTAPASISIQATAADVDGTIAKVEFFNGATKLGEDTTSPYAYAWSNVAAGGYTLTAKATDNSGAITTSAVRSVTVTAASNQPPVVSFTRPANGAQFPTGSTVSVTVSAVDLGGSIANVKLYLNGQFVRQENVVPYTWGESGQNDVLLTRMAAGTYTLEAVATDNGGATRSATIQIVVIAANQPPVAMAGVNPTSGSVTNEFYFWATDSYDPDGTIVSYAWQIAGTQVSTNVEFLHTFATGGMHTVTLTVRDNAGASDSDAVVVNVSEAVLPVVSVAVSDATAGEPGLAEGTGKFLVSRSGDLTQAISVRYAMSGIASNGMDFTKLSGTVTLAAGKSSASVTLTPLADAADETDETAILTLLAGNGYTVDGAKSAGTVTIKDQTYGTPVVSAVATDASAVEPGVTANKGAIKVSRTGSCHAALTVSCVMGGTALNGVDYTTVTVPVTLAVGQSAKTLTIAPLADAVVDSNETATLTIQDNIAYQIGAGQASATVNIADTTQLSTPTLSVVATDPTAVEPTNGVVNTGTFTFRRTSRFHEALVVNYTVGGTASNSVDYNTLSATVTIPAGVATKTLTITTKADGGAEGTETVIVSISASSVYTIDGAKAAATVTITD